MADIPGIDLILQYNSNVLEAQTDATLSSTRAVADAISKDNNFEVKKNGDGDWEISSTREFVDDTAKHAITNGNAELRLELDKDNDTTYQFETIPVLTSVTLSLEQDLSERSPGINDPVGWTYYVPTSRTFSVEAEGYYRDPANSDIYAALHDEREAGNNVGAEVDILGATFSGEVAHDSMDLEAGGGDVAGYSFSWQGSGEITQSGTIETTISDIIDLYLNQSKGTVSLRHRENGSDVTGSTYWEGDVYLSSWELTLERNEMPEISEELQGTGSLTRNQVT